MLTLQRVRELLHYGPETGVFTWLSTANKRVKVGAVAGSYGGGHGYCRISIDGRLYRAHRLAWLYVTGAWPVAEIDHINGDPSDNRIVNLREATSSQNKANTGCQRNNKSGFKGVSWDKRRRRWRATINKDGHHIHLGYFATAEAAHAAYVKTAGEFHGEFARTP